MPVSSGCCVRQTALHLGGVLSCGFSDRLLGLVMIGVVQKLGVGSEERRQRTAVWWETSEGVRRVTTSVGQ